MIQYPSLTWLSKALYKLGFIYPQYESDAYCGYTTAPDLLLTTSFQKVTGWNELVSPVNITYSNGTFKSLLDGIFEWHLERIYTNADSNPTNPIVLAIEVRKNGVVVFNRELIIGAATNPSEPNSSSFTSPFIFAVNADDKFEFFVKATMGISNPQSTRLVRMQLSANKIHNLGV